MPQVLPVATRVHLVILEQVVFEVKVLFDLERLVSLNTNYIFLFFWNAYIFLRNFPWTNKTPYVCQRYPKHEIFCKARRPKHTFFLQLARPKNTLELVVKN